MWDLKSSFEDIRIRGGEMKFIDANLSFWVWWLRAILMILKIERSMPNRQQIQKDPNEYIPKKLITTVEGENLEGEQRVVRRLDGDIHHRRQNCSQRFGQVNAQIRRRAESLKISSFKKKQKTKIRRINSNN